MDRPHRATVAITTGEPAGIGPELCASLPPDGPLRLILLGDRSFLASRARQAGIPAKFCDFHPVGYPPAGHLEVMHEPLLVPAIAGELDPDNADYVLALLDRALLGCDRGQFDAMVTAPIHKGVIRDAGYEDFTGHTEYLAERTGTPQVVMMLVGGNMRVALATTHLPLRDVADALNAAELMQTLRILHADLRSKVGIENPRIIVAGLNPHAGEGGHLGEEEIDIIIPVLDYLRNEGMSLIGPLPADTLFNPALLGKADAVLAMYHDQGLPVLKYASFGHGVNITLGLPIIRTSVDHGTAIDLAGTGRADSGSLHAALLLSQEVIQRRASRSKA